MPRAALIGPDATGAGLAARFVLNGWDVVIADPQVDLAATLARARQWLPMLSDGALPPEGRQIHAKDMQEAAQGADYVHVFDARNLADLPRLASGAVLCWSGDVDQGAGIEVSFADPAWLLPLALLMYRANISDQCIDKVKKIYQSLGMAPVWRQPDGKAHAAFADGAPMTGAEIAALGPGLLAACGGLTGAERDGALVGMLRSLKDRDLGVGRALNAADAQRHRAAAAEYGALVRLQVLPSWIDYNGHMTESRYLYACSETTDAFLRRIGAGLDYVATGFSYYSAETHIRHLGETRLGDRLTGSVQVLMADAKRLHLFVTLRRGDQVVATLEQMLLHVDMQANRACPAHPDVLARLMPIAEAHKARPRPAGAGRRVGDGR